MKIGIIGYGGMAKALAGKWSVRHEIMLSGRNRTNAAEAAAAVGAIAGAPAEAAGFGEVIVLATQHADVFTAIEDAGGPDAFAGKVVIDINNTVSIEVFLSTRTDERSLTQALADALPGAHIGRRSTWRRSMSGPIRT